MKNLVLLVESLVANDAISKMCKWVKKDPESVACINEINKLKMLLLFMDVHVMNLSFNLKGLSMLKR